MGHTFTNPLYHQVFSTKGRRPFITPEVKDRIYKYYCGVARNLGGTVLKINGPEEHVHTLVRLPASIDVPEFLQKTKGNSSRWTSKTFPELVDFNWQNGYASFTVSESNWKQVADYIDKQIEHHRTMTFKEELEQLLKKHGIQYDPEHFLD